MKKKTPPPPEWFAREAAREQPHTDEETYWRLDRIQAEMRARGVPPVSTTRSVRRREKRNHETTLRDVEQRWAR